MRAFFILIIVPVLHLAVDKRCEEIRRYYGSTDSISATFGNPCWSVNQAMARKLPTLEHILLYDSGGDYIFESALHSTLNYAAINVPHMLEIITRRDKAGKAIFAYTEVFYIINAYECDIPSKEKFIKFDELGTPKLSWVEMKAIFEAESNVKVK